MSDQNNFEICFYSPRWGHEDTYKITMDRQQMRIDGVMKHAICTWVENKNPRWTGHNEGIGNPLQNVLENDSIYPPTVFVRALEHAWTAWRDGKLDDQQVQIEVQQLCDWVNKTSRNRPNTDFWRSIF